MSRARRAPSSNGPAALVLAWGAGLVLFAALALWSGEDVNWDLQNYHDYGPYALLHGRAALDVGAAGIQGYFNPLPYLPVHALRHALPPPLAAVGLAAIQALVVPAAWMLAGALAAAGPLPRAAATLTAVTGAMALSEAGTSFADLALAAPVLLGLLALIRAWDGGNARLFPLAGLLVGAAVGLKLTNVAFVPALAAATLLPWRGAAAGWAAAWRVAAGGAAGILLTGGAWAFHLWTSLGNPVFPAMNGVFRSASANPDSFADLRFVPAGVGDALLYPLRIALGGHPTAEFPSADPRPLLGLALALLLVGAALAGRRDAAPGGAARLRAAVFLLAATAVWLPGFAIHRYAIVLDALAGLLLVLLPAALLPARAGRPVALAVAALALGATRVPDWGHRPWSEARPLAPPAALKEPAAILVVAHPVGIWGPALPAASRLYAVTDTGLATGGVLRARMEAGLRAPPGGRIWTLGPDLPMEASTRATMAAYGVLPTGPCHRVPGAAGTPAVFCGARRAPPRPLAAPDLPAGAAVDFTPAGEGWTFLVARPPPEPAGWDVPGPQGTAAADGARLVLRPAAGDGPRALRFDLHLADPRPGRVGVFVNGRPAAAWDLPAGPDRVGRLVCLPGGTVGDGGVSDVVLRDASGGEGSMPALRRMVLDAAAPGECPS